jgi:CHAT domain-containing protein
MKRSAIFIFMLFLSHLFYLLLAQGVGSSKPEFEDQIETLYKNGKLDEALRLSDSALSIAQKNKNWKAFTVYTAKISKILKEQKKYEIALTRIEEFFTILKLNNLAESESAGSLWMWKALNERMLQHWEASLYAYQKAIHCYEQLHSLNPNLAFSYKNAAQIYLRWSDNYQAIDYLKEAMRCDTLKKHTVSVCNQLAISYLFLDSLDKAKLYFSKIDLTSKGPYMGSVFASGAEIEFLEKNYKQAAQYALIAIDSFIKKPGEGDNVIRMYSFLAKIASDENNIQKAIRNFSNAELEGKKYYNNYKSRELAKLFVEEAYFYNKIKNNEKALQYFQSALIQAIPTFDQIDWHKTPPPSLAYPEWQIVRAATGKANILLDNSNPSFEYRSIAADCFDLGLEAAAKLRNQSIEESDKLDLIKNVRIWTTKSIENLIEIQRIVPSLSNCARLLQSIERSKSQALRDAVHQKSLFDYITIPDSIRAREKLLRGAVASTKNELIENMLAGEKIDSIEANLLNTELFRTEFAYRELIDQLKTEHPAFGAQLAADPVLNVDSLRASLPDSAAILSFFDTGNRYLLLTTTRKGIELNEIPCDTAFKNLLSGFIQRLSDRSAQENDPERYYQDAWLLYQKLLPAKALAGIKSLTIIPDGALCYLPFEALLTQAYKGSYARAPYLMRSYNVAYNWSAAIPLQAGKSGRGMLQVAPFTNSARDGLAVLPNSRLEADNHIHLQSLTDATASAAAFCEKSSDYAVLHIATHAQAGGQNLPRVEFFDRSLSAQEIYGLRLNASLATLSACETGAGKYAGGEGVLSLARAFAAVGARSLVASHWTVNEFSTSQLFKSFYTYLFAGQTKSESLRAAKLAYLDSEAPDARKAPFYWAAFTLTGADGKVDLGGGFPWVYLWLALGVIGAVLLIRRFFV